MPNIPSLAPGSFAFPFGFHDLVEQGVFCDEEPPIGRSPTEFHVVVPHLAAKWLPGVDKLKRRNTVRAFDPHLFVGRKLLCVRLRDLPCLDFHGGELFLDSLDDGIVYFPFEGAPPLLDSQVLDGWTISPCPDGGAPSISEFRIEGAKGVKSLKEWQVHRSQGWLTLTETLSSLGIGGCNPDNYRATVKQITESFDSGLYWRDTLYKPVTLDSLAERGELLNFIKSVCRETHGLVARCMLSDSARASVFRALMEQ